ncbi:molybdate ABC transporter substrate-binding protein [Microbacterium betulae]|uniref:Molybdate ABC transporter substrate-binding protein n=1 Tax=Microbacterium betulae TaxID=2981139 RepID=A0AA97FKV2_9MICO|nr:molybdate ABC transporter substrate-binding protein [Microbacterium sp. AB]WOF23302.1 molybdate ABC transporter substrate-binding protein [Microbacterium sp. AB]
MTARPAIRTALLAVAAIGAVALSGCSGTPAAEETASPAPEERELQVFAAASLTETFTALADDFEAENPGVTVQLNFDGSSGLATQIVEGAPAGVFAAANTSTMDSVVAEGLTAADPVLFVRNVLEIAVPAGNPAGITSFADLADPDVTLVVCAVEVPCGAATQKVEESTGVELTPVSEENAVTDVLGKVTAGEADAGLVYATDVLGAGDSVEGIPFDEAQDALNDYPIAPLTGADDPELAQDFVDFVLGEHAQEELTAAGFLPAE